jgi:hypothetical protein
MKKCMECDKEFDEQKRKSQWWIRQYKAMGACADICDECWRREYKIDVKDK